MNDQETITNQDPLMYLLMDSPTLRIQDMPKEPFMTKEDLSDPLTEMDYLTINDAFFLKSHNKILKTSKHFVDSKKAAQFSQSQTPTTAAPTQCRSRQLNTNALHRNDDEKAGQTDPWK